MAKSKFSQLAPIATLENEYILAFADVSGNRNVSSTVDKFRDLFLANSSNYFVDTENGNDTNSGTVISPFKTIAHAISVISALVPADNNRFTINILNDAESASNFTLPRFVNLKAESATLTGLINCNGEQYIYVNRLKNNNNDIFQSGAFGKKIYIKYNEAFVIGDYSVIKHQSVLHRFVVHGVYTNYENFSSSDTQVISVTPSDSNPDNDSMVHLEHVHFSAAGANKQDPVVVYFSGSSPEKLIAKVDRITRDAGVSNITGFHNASTGTIIASIGSGDCDTSYNISNASGRIVTTEIEGFTGTSTGIGTLIQNVHVEGEGSAQQVLIKRNGKVLTWDDLNYINSAVTEINAYTQYTDPSIVTTWWLDNDPPEITEGVQIGQTSSYTPKQIGNVLKVTASFEMGRRPVDATRVWGHIALFLNGVTNALASKPKLYPTLTSFDTYIETLSVKIFHTVTSLDPVQFQVRGGINGFGTADEFTINGNSFLGQRGGGTARSRIEIEERG